MFPERIKSLRKENKLNQAELGKIFNVSGPSISKWELGYAQPDNETLIKIADYFNVSIDWLLGKNQTQDEKLIELMQKAEKNHNLKMIFDKLSREPSDKDLEKIKDLMNLMIDDEDN